MKFSGFDEWDEIPTDSVGISETIRRFRQHSWPHFTVRVDTSPRHIIGLQQGKSGHIYHGVR